MSLGSIENARTAINLGFDINAPYNFEDDVPHQNKNLGNGWVLIARGCSRTAYRGPDGYVYKVTRTAERSDINQSEYENIVRVKSDPYDGWDVPEAALITIDEWIVIVMEYINGERYYERAHGDYCEVEDYWSLFDLGGHNIIHKDGVNYVIDLGE